MDVISPVAQEGLCFSAYKSSKWTGLAKEWKLALEMALSLSD